MHNIVKYNCLRGKISKARYIMVNYDYVLLDADDTLFNYGKSETASFHADYEIRKLLDLVPIVIS